MNSPDYQQVEAMAAAYAGDEDSLADIPSYRAAAEIASASGTVVQIQIVDVALLAVSPVREDFTTESEELGVLPLYELGVFAHRVEEGEQIAEVILIYGSEANAEAAAVEVAARLEKYTSMVIQQPLMDILDERGITLETPRVVENESTGKWATVIAFTSPVPPEEPSEGDLGGQIVQSALNYSLLINMLYQRDLGWLTPN
jgi:galactitol-specific phosphotransferase system IIB component